MEPIKRGYAAREVLRYRSLWKLTQPKPLMYGGHPFDGKKYGQECAACTHTADTKKDLEKTPRSLRSKHASMISVNAREVPARLKSTGVGPILGFSFVESTRGIQCDHAW